MLPLLLNTSKNDDLLFLSGIIISILNEKKEGESTQSVLPELFSTLGIEGTVNLIKYFGGESIAIPSHDEMYKSFLVLLCYYKRKVENKSWEDVRAEVGVDISPHALGKIIKLIDQRITLEVQELEDLGMEEFIGRLKQKKEEAAAKTNNKEEVAPNV